MYINDICSSVLFIIPLSTGHVTWLTLYNFPFLRHYIFFISWNRSRDGAILLALGLLTIRLSVSQEKLTRGQPFSCNVVDLTVPYAKWEAWIQNVFFLYVYRNKPPTDTKFTNVRMFPLITKTCTFHLLYIHKNKHILVKSVGQFDTSCTINNLKFIYAFY